ncbi:hypothetical protein B0H14DRAFT_2632466 [Mycena olivaceomarginata]|nr:hypothetical protein B0H14DRAFT_2632466 [Mycena olivaceomarginata]
MEPANRLSVLSLNELSLQCRLQLQRGHQLQRELQLQREDSLQRRSVRDPSGLAPPVQCPLLGTTPRPIFVSNIKAFFSADSDYESFKNRINEVAAQHLEMERYLDHQDEDAKKKFSTKFFFPPPKHEKFSGSAACRDQSICSQLFSPQKHEKFGGSRLAGRRAGRDRYLSLRINTICSQLFAPQKHEKLGGFGGSRLAGRSAGGEPFVFVFGLFATETLFLWRTTQKQMVLTLTEHTDALFVFEVFPVFSATEAREAPLVFGLLATETSFFPPQRHEKLVGSLVFGLFATETFVFSATEAREARRVALGGSLGDRCLLFLFLGRLTQKIGAHSRSVGTRAPEHADALFCLEDHNASSPLDVIRVTTPFCSAMGCSPMEAHRSIVLASPWVFHCLLKTTLRVGDHHRLRGSKELFPDVTDSSQQLSRHRRTRDAPFVLSYRKPIRVLHYSTSRPTARWTTVSTIFQNSRADALRYPVVENVCYRDADRQPWIHDFDVTLEHGQKIASFRIFLKRGITLLPNKYSLRRYFVNVRSTDRPAANYIFNEALQRMKDFQSKKRIRLPPVLELTLEGNPPFPFKKGETGARMETRATSYELRMENTHELFGGVHRPAISPLLAILFDLPDLLRGAHRPVVILLSASHVIRRHRDGRQRLLQLNLAPRRPSGSRNAVAKVQEVQRILEPCQDTIEQLQRENGTVTGRSGREWGHQMAHQAIEMEGSISKHWEGMFQTGMTLLHQSEQLKLQTMEATVREAKEAEAAAKEREAKKQQELEKQKAEYDNKLAAFISRTSFVASAPQPRPIKVQPTARLILKGHSSSIDWDEPRGLSQRFEGRYRPFWPVWAAKKFRCPPRAERRTRTSKMTVGQDGRQQPAGLLTNEEDLQVEGPNVAAFYNQRIIDAMVEKALKMRAATETNAQRAWKQHQPRMGETAEQARMRAEAYEAQRATRVLSLSRKTQKLEGRIRVVKKIMHIETAKKSQETAKNWQWILELLEHLGTGGMSSEDDIDAETAVAGKTMITTVHLVKICPWRSEEVTKYLHWIDRAAESNCRQTSQQAATRSNLNSRQKTPPPPRVPREIYNASWNLKRAIHEVDQNSSIRR